MARTPAPIPKKARELWQAGDEEGAARLAQLRPRQLRNRLGAPGRSTAEPAAAASPGPVSAAASGGAPRVVHIPAATPSPPHSPPPSSPDPTAADIEAMDTLDEARAILRDIRAKMPTADDVRYASLAEKALSAINRIEQIEAKRPRPPARDEVVEALRGVEAKAIERIGILTSEAAAKLASDRAAFATWCGTLGPIGLEVVRRVDAMIEPRTTP